MNIVGSPEKNGAQPGFEPGACHMLVVWEQPGLCKSPEATIIPLDLYEISKDDRRGTRWKTSHH